MNVTITVRDEATDALGRVAPNVRRALAAALDPLARTMTQDVRTRALAHIHTFGKKPGLYLASIFGGVSDKGTRITGYVRSGNNLAHLLEAGVADTGAHDILRKNGRALKFLAGADTVYARLVHHPGATIPAYPAFGPALAARRDAIRRTLVEAAEAGARLR